MRPGILDSQEIKSNFNLKNGFYQSVNMCKNFEKIAIQWMRYLPFVQPNAPAFQYRITLQYEPRNLYQLCVLLAASLSVLGNLMYLCYIGRAQAYTVPELFKEWCLSEK